jgi:hypothetical protein
MKTAQDVRDYAAQKGLGGRSGAVDGSPVEFTFRLAGIYARDGLRLRSVQAVRKQHHAADCQKASFLS